MNPKRTHTQCVKNVLHEPFKSKSVIHAWSGDELMTATLHRADDQLMTGEEAVTTR